MRPIIQFFLIAAILILTILAWNVNSSQIDSVFPKNVAQTLQEIDNIRQTTDIVILREKAIASIVKSNSDDNYITRGMAYIKLGNLLVLMLVLAVIAQIIAFFDIAAKGKVPPTKAMRQPGSNR